MIDEEVAKTNAMDQSIKVNDAENLHELAFTEKKKRLEEQFHNESEVKEQNQPISRDLTSERTAWLEEQTHKSPHVNHHEEPISHELTAERISWLEEQANKIPSVRDNAEPISHDLIDGRMAWLEEQANKSPTSREHEEPISHELIAGRTAWLEEQANKSHATKEHEEPISHELTSGRIACLEENANKMPSVRDNAEPISHDLIDGRMAWLEEQANKSPTSREHEEPISHELIAGRTAWLEEQANKSHATKEHEEPISHELTSGRIACLEERANGAHEQSKTKEPERQCQLHVSTESASETVRRIKEKMNADSNKGKHSGAEMMAPTRSLASERMNMIREKQQKFANLGKSPAILSDSGDEVDGQEKIKADSNKGKQIMAPTRSLASEKMNMIRDAQQKFANLGKSPQRKSPEIPNDGGDEVDSQQEMNADSNECKQQMAPTRSLASEKMNMIRDAQQKFANLGKPSEIVNESEVEVVGLKKVASKFGETVKPKTAVQRRREELERKQKEAIKRNDHQAHMQVSWKKAGAGPSKFSKSSKDSRGIAPKRSILDLP